VKAKAAGSTKKKAEQRAAKDALELLRKTDLTPHGPQDPA